MKKLLVILLTFVFLSNTAYATNYEEIKTDLTKYNIITNYELTTVTRAEMVKIIMTMSGFEIKDNADTIFTDVTSDYWASGYIDAAYKSGIINGMGDGTFAPEQYVTNEQIVKMLVCALGYEPATTRTYPYDYFIKATDLGITNGLDLKGTETAKREEVAKMVFNSLDIPIMYQNGFGSFTTYIIADGTDGNPKKTLRINLDGMLNN